MLEHSRERALGSWRRWTFRIWIGLTVVLAVYIAVTLPFVRDDRVGHLVLGAPIPFAMIALLAIGLGWLIWLVTSSRRRSRGRGR